MKNHIAFASRVWLIYFAAIILFALTVSIGENWFFYVSNVVLIAGLGLMLYNDGAYFGEKDATSAHIVRMQIEGGRAVSNEELLRMWSVSKGVKSALIAAAPLVLIAILDMCFKGAFAVGVGEEGVEGVLYPVNILARVAFFPFVALFPLLEPIASAAISPLDLAFVPMAFVAPAAAFVGYLMGPHYREKKLKQIEQGSKRKRRNLKVNRKPKVKEPPKPEV